MLKLLKLFIDIKECLNFIEILSEENDKLSEIIDIVLQTINQ